MNNNKSREETTGTALFKSRSLLAGMVWDTGAREIVPLKHHIAGGGQGHGQPENKASPAESPSPPTHSS